jgi:hypothetical protein
MRTGLPFLRARKPDLEKPGAETALAGDERRAPGGAGLLGVVVGKDRALFGDAVDVGRAVAHHTAVVRADVPVADIVAKDDEDVRLLALGLKGGVHPRVVVGKRRKRSASAAFLSACRKGGVPEDRQHGDD